MFINFFYRLREQAVPVTPGELLDFLQVLEVRLEQEGALSPSSFYHLAKASLIKNPKFFQVFDQVFLDDFGELFDDEEFQHKLKKWLSKAKQFDPKKALSPQQVLSKDLLKELEKRLKEQKKRHDGGNHWLGTGGSSAFGNSGQNPAGIRVGGRSLSRSALAVVGERDYGEYRTDLTLGVRNYKLALKKLRKLTRSGKPKFDIEKSIQRTCDNGGEIEIVYSNHRKNQIKLCLIADIGGSMDIYSERVEQLFSALHQMNHFRSFNTFYFHNTIYDHLYTDSQLGYDKRITLEKFFATIEERTVLVFLGDAMMAPYELFEMNGSLADAYRFYQARSRVEFESPASIFRLEQMAKRYQQAVWINPEPRREWSHPTVNAISKLWPMTELSVDGLERAVKYILGAPAP